LALDGVPGHISDHGLVQNDAGTLAHVFVGSRRVIVPHRRPTPEGGGAATPVSSRARGCAQKKGEAGWGYCSPWRVEPEATAGAEREAKERARVDGDPGGAPADGEGAPGGVKDVNLQQHMLDKPLVNPRSKKEGRRRLSFTGGDEITTAAAGTRGGALVELGSSAWSRCVGKAKGGAGDRARV
jgi:hypothetical protein